MRKKIKNNIMPILLLVALIAIVFLSNELSVNADNSKVIDYSTKSFYDTFEDGWVYLFKIYYPEDGSNRKYIFNGYNLKYKTMDGYSIPIVDELTGKVLYEVVPDYITLVNSKEYQDDLYKIRDFFNSKQYNSKITINDLDLLNITVVSKEYLVFLFNNAIESNLEKADGPYANAPVAGRVSLESSNEKLEGEWQVSYILRNGDIYDINIEFIDLDNNYLLEKTSKKTLSKNDLDLINEIEKIEDDFVSNQGFYANSKEKNSDSTILNNNEDLNKLLSILQKELES